MGSFKSYCNLFSFSYSSSTWRVAISRSSSSLAADAIAFSSASRCSFFSLNILVLERTELVRDKCEYLRHTLFGCDVINQCCQMSVRINVWFQMNITDVFFESVKNTHPSIVPSIHPFIMIYPNIHPSVRPSVQFIHLFIHKMHLLMNTNLRIWFMIWQVDISNSYIIRQLNINMSRRLI